MGQETRSSLLVDQEEPQDGMETASEDRGQELCPSLLEKYQIERKLGEGGGGCVYLAKDRELGRYVALKHRKALTTDDQHRVEMLLQEARTVANLRHPNVAVVHATESYPESGDYCVVMEYADGGTLADLLGEEDRLSLEKALDIGIEICTALGYVHRQKLVHRDIKPSNVLFFCTDGQMDIKIADFGLSQNFLLSVQQTEGEQDAFSGTLEYAAPELLGGEAIDKRVDLYSLGSVLYHMLTGEPPFPFRGDVDAVIAGHVHGERTPLQEARPAVFDELNTLVLKALARSPAERFRDAEAMLAALSQTQELCVRLHKQAEDLYDQGVRSEEQQKWSRVVEYLEQAYKMNPELEDVEERLQYARLQLELKTTWRELEELMSAEAWADALEQLGRISALDETYRTEQVRERTEKARLQLELASLYGDAREAEGAGKRREAIRRYVDIVARDDSYKDAAQRLAKLREEEDLENLWARGERSLQRENWEEAIEIYGKIRDRRRDYPGAAQKLAYAQRQLELATLYDQALVELEDEDWDRAEKTLHNITGREPGYRDAAVRLAKVSRRRRLIQLRERVKRVIEAHEWAEAETLLQELLRLEPGDEDAQRQRRHVGQFQNFESLYKDGKGDIEAHQWDEAIGKFEEALRIADAACLDLHNYRDIRALVDQAKTSQQLHVLSEEAKHYEEAEDFNALIQVLERMLKLDSGNEKAFQWKQRALQQMRLKDLRRRASSRMEQGDWTGAKRLLDEIASVDAEFENIQAMQKQVQLGQGVNFMRHWGFALLIVLGAGLLLLLVPTLFWRLRGHLGLGQVVITPEFIGSVVSVFTLIASLIGIIVPKEKLYESLERDRRLRACLSLGVLLLISFLGMLLVMALFPPPERINGLCNGSFDEGFKCWDKEGKLKKTVECKSSRCFAVLGDPDYRCEGGIPVGEARIEQSFTVTETVSPTLSLRYRVFSYDILTSDLDESDYFRVSIDDTSLGEFGNTEWLEPICDGAPWDSGWKTAVIDLSAYRGKEVKLSFQNVNSTYGWWNTWTYVDDVEVH